MEPKDRQTEKVWESVVSFSTRPVFHYLRYFLHNFSIEKV
jgi:ATP sulfurylase